MMVMTCHFASYFGGGERTVVSFFYTGVHFFFVISGYVFAPHVFRGQVAVRSFFIRRFFRIYPLYFVSLALYFFLVPGSPSKSEYFLNHALMLHTWHSREEAFFFNAAYWSLPSEVEYYLAVPLLALLIRNSGAMLAGCAGLALLLHVWVFDAPVLGGGVLKVHLPGLLVEFLVGMLAYRSGSGKPWPAWGCAVAIGASLTAIAVLAGFFVNYGDEGAAQFAVTRLGFNLMCAIAYAALLAATVQWYGLKTPVHPRWRVWALWAGKMSYAVYLFHGVAPVLTASLAEAPGLRFLVSATATIFFALLINHVFEAPLQRFGVALSRRFDPEPSVRLAVAR